jgi:hypothetical protein
MLTVGAGTKPRAKRVEPSRQKDLSASAMTGQWSAAPM